jgi:hypothetical protein
MIRRLTVPKKSPLQEDASMAKGGASLKSKKAA